jgi:hypothetical protein
MSKLTMGIDWIDNPRVMVHPRVKERQERVRKWEETKRKHRRGYERDCQDAALVVATHPSHKSDPFAYRRALALMLGNILTPAEVLDAKGAISV